MGQPHCRTCPFIDLRPVEGSLTPGVEGLCRVLPENWPRRRLDLDWCGKHPEIIPESLHDRMIRAINEAPPPSRPSTLDRLALSAQRLSHMLEFHGPAEDDIWDIGIVLKSRHTKQWIEEWGHLTALVSKLEAENPATPESDGA